ncbi:hypothetical protein DGG96_07385 [Legionella qingyii]|uniref:Uncharacterized protein n=1 Tax=Legionella qingyii TaxID=2184757 RepID=A0A317U4H9_9GAMM|nr:hypothetical protein DGG96_07385 [Legionella qingyii]
MFKAHQVSSSVKVLGVKVLTGLVRVVTVVMIVVLVVLTKVLVEEIPNNVGTTETKSYVVKAEHYGLGNDLVFST